VIGTGSSRGLIFKVNSQGHIVRDAKGNVTKNAVLTTPEAKRLGIVKASGVKRRVSRPGWQNTLANAYRNVYR
jgi:hypothetical protein